MQSIVTHGPSALGKRKKIDYKDNLTDEKYYLFIKQVLNELIRVTKKYIFFNIQPVSGNKKTIWKIFGDFNDKIKEVIIWKKTRFPPAVNKSVLSHNYEFIIIFDKNNANKRSFSNLEFSRKGNMTTCWEGEPNDLFYKDSFNKEGLGAIFPRWLPTKIIKNFTKEGEIVLDPFMGSGTTAVVAKELKRKYIGFEKDDENYKISKERVSKLILIDDWI